MVTRTSTKRILPLLAGMMATISGWPSWFWLRTDKIPSSLMQCSNHSYLHKFCTRMATWRTMGTRCRFATCRTVRMTPSRLRRGKERLVVGLATDLPLGARRAMRPRMQGHIETPNAEIARSQTSTTRRRVGKPTGQPWGRPRRTVVKAGNKEKEEDAHGKKPK